MRHGEAVAIGMVAAARIAGLLGTCPPHVADRLVALLDALRLPTRIAHMPLSRILSAMRSDKKTLRGIPRFVLPREIGVVQPGCEVPAHIVETALLQLGAST